MKKFLIPVAVITGAAVLYAAYYTISPLFRNIEMNEAVPQAIQLQTEGADSVAMQSEQTVPVSSPVVDTPAHPASGNVRVIKADDKTYVRYENYKTINGPDLYVYLAKDLDAKEFVSLGKIRATEGNVNYEVPSNVDISEYRYVLTWCQQFGVLFNSAELPTAS